MLMEVKKRRARLPPEDTVGTAQGEHGDGIAVLRGARKDILRHGTGQMLARTLLTRAQRLLVVYSWPREAHHRTRACS